MKHAQFLKITSTLALTLILAACGGGASDSNHAGVDDGTVVGTTTTGTTKTGLYSGSITGFGSTIVNGVRFSTIGASVTDNDAHSLTNDDLHIGTTVQIVGTSDDAAGTGAATSIVVVHGVQGSISAIAAPELTVLGQRVVTNASTAYQNVTALAGLVVGDTVEAYGPTQADGSVLATLIEKKVITAASLPGVVSNLNTTAKTFTINGVTVNYGTATVTGTLVNGVNVRVNSASLPSAGSAINATQVSVSNDTSVYSANATGVLKIKGIASGAPVNGVVTVSGTPVNVSSTAYQGGTAIVAGSYIEVRGTWNGTTLVANLVEFDGYHAAQIGGKNELYGVVGTYTSLSNFVVNGVTVDASTAVVTGSLSGLTTGAYIEVKGNMVGNVLKATRVEMKSATSPTGGYYETYGTVSNFVSLASFTVNGVTVNASGAFVEHPERGAVANGRYIEMKGSQNASGVFIATKIEVKY
jgi:hypothetical protein